MNSFSVSQKKNKPEEVTITLKFWLINFCSYKSKSTFLDAETEEKEKTDATERVNIGSGCLLEIVALGFQTVGKTTFLFNTIDDLSKENSRILLPS